MTMVHYPPRIVRLLAMCLALAALPGLALLQRGAPSPAVAAGGPSIDYLANLGGGLPQLALDGGYAYLAEGSSLTVLDISDPDQPTRKAWRSLANSAEYIHAEALAKAGNLLIISGGRRLFAVDVTNPLQPQIAGNPLGITPSHQLASDGGQVYLLKPSSNGSGGVAIGRVNLGDPANLAVQALVSDPAPEYAGTIIAGGRAYIFERSGKITIYNLQSLGDPPAPAGTYNSPAAISALAAVGQTLYLADAAGGLRIINATDPQNLQDLGSYTPATATSPTGLAVSDGKAYLATSNAGTQIIAVSNPAQPALLGTISGIAGATALQVQGQQLLQAGAAGWQLADIANPAQPTPHHVYPAITDVQDVEVAYGKVYIGGSAGSGLQILDLSDLDQPQRVGADPGLGIGSLAVRGGHVLARGDSPFGVYSFDVSDPARPARVGFYPIPYLPLDRTTGLKLSGDLAYIATTQGGLRIIDAANPAQLTLRGSLALGQYPALINVDGTRAYIVDNRNRDYTPAFSGSIAVVDIHNPGQPVLVWSYGSPGWRNPRGIDVADGFLYLATEAGGKIEDLTMPAEVVGTNTNTGPADQVQVVDDLAFFVMNKGLHVVNVSDPRSPELVVAYNPIIWCCTDIEVVPEPGASGSYLVYVAAGELGLHLFRVRDLPAIPTRTPQPTQTPTATATTTPTATAIPPSLAINYTSGAPGSTFLISGSGLPAGGYTLALNGNTLRSIQVGGGGALQVALNTAPNAVAGRYDLTLDQSTGARAGTPPAISYRLAPDAPLHRLVPPSTTPSLDIPAAIAPRWENPLFLPVVE